MKKEIGKYMKNRVQVRKIRKKRILEILILYMNHIKDALSSTLLLLP
jgi:hypothetical protein